MKWLILITSLYCSSLFAQDRGEMIRIMKGDYYQALGVSENATAEEIKAAYRRLVRTYHPDRQQHPANIKAANEIMSKVNEVYDTLRDPLRKKAYNITRNITESLKPKTATAAAEVWEKWNFTEFKKPEPTVKKTSAKAEPRAQAEPQVQPEPKAEPKAQAQQEFKTSNEKNVSPEVRERGPIPLKGRQAQKLYGEVSRCGAGYSQSLIDELI